MGNFQDIVHYTRTQIARSMYLRKLPTNFQREIVDKLTKDPQGRVSEMVPTVLRDLAYALLWAGLML